MVHSLEAVQLWRAATKARSSSLASQVVCERALASLAAGAPGGEQASGVVHGFGVGGAAADEAGGAGDAACCSLAVAGAGVSDPDATDVTGADAEPASVAGGGELVRVQPTRDESASSSARRRRLGNLRFIRCGVYTWGGRAGSGRKNARKFAGAGSGSVCGRRACFSGGTHAEARTRRARGDLFL
jgi:hypothetical protein